MKYYLLLTVSLLFGVLLFAEEKKLPTPKPVPKAATVRLPDGRYIPDPKRSYFAGEIITIKGSSFHYRFFTDAVGHDKEYSGKVLFYSDRILLDHPSIPFPYRIPGIISGTPVLWEWEGFQEWKKTGKINDYHILYLEKKKA